MLEPLFLYSSMAGGLFLGVQLVMMLLGLSDEGADGGGGLDGDIGGDGAGEGDESWIKRADGDFDSPGTNWFYELFSLRSLAGAALFFGLTGKTALAYGASQTTATAYATLAGAAALYVVYWVFKKLFQLESSGNIDLQNAIGERAKVYIPIPPAGEGVGKVQFTMQNRVVEYAAINNTDAPLKTGDQVVIIDLATADTVRVEAV